MTNQHHLQFNPNRLDYDDPNNFYYFYNNAIMPSLSYTYSSLSSNSSSPASLLPYFNPDPFCIPSETWSVAEQAASVILNRVHPTVDADQKRKDVTDYLQTLIASAIRSEVVPYGSVPLKTYLPDGDIDLTALSATKTSDDLASDIRAVLEGQNNNQSGHYEIRDVQFIDAEVKLVKCVIQNIVVDISFNQLGGICTLCFLEQVDRHIGKNHLFKRSIILIKAWCYYESRILGAHHGLISTYALETLVLYIFNMFHSSLDGPVAVLYRFLDYFSKFDWDNYCISLNGPVPRASLPDVLADIPDNGWNDVLLSADFLKNCVDMFSVPSKDPETNTRTFIVKHLNIIDPLKVNNNLGRSVHRGNFYRIRSALRYGARELGWILSLPGDRLSDELRRFFSNSMDKHGNIYWDSMPNPLFPLGVEDPGTSSCTTTLSERNSVVGYAENEFSLTGEEAFTSKEDLDCYPTELADCQAYSGLEDEFDKTYSEFVTTGGAYSVSDCSVATCDTDSSSLSLDHSYSVKETDILDNGHQYQDGDEKTAVMKKSRSLSILPKDVPAFTYSNPEDVFSGESEESDPLLDLTGDYECHIRSLLYGLNCHGYALSATPANSFKPFSRLRSRYQYESINHSSQFKQTVRCNGKASCFASARLPFQSSHHGVSSNFVVRAADNQKNRGTGTYIPSMNQPLVHEALQPDSPSSGSGSGTTTLDTMAAEDADYCLSEAHFPALCELKSGLHPSSESSMGNPHSLSPDKLEFGSFKRCQSIGASSERNKQKTNNYVKANDSDIVEGAAVGRFEPVLNAKLGSVTEQALVLEDAAEFPPLSI